MKAEPSAGARQLQSRLRQTVGSLISLLTPPPTGLLWIGWCRAAHAALQGKQHSEQLHHIFFNFLFISILSKSRTKVCINGGKENECAVKCYSQGTCTAPLQVLLRDVFSLNPPQAFKCLRWQRLKRNKWNSLFYKNYIILKHLKKQVGVFSAQLYDSTHFYTGQVHVLSVRLCILPDMPMNTKKMQAPPPPPVFVGELGCVKEGRGCVVEVKGVCWGSQVKGGQRADDTCISPRRNRVSAGVLPAKSWGHYRIVSDFCELCLSPFTCRPCCPSGSFPAHCLHEAQGNEVEYRINGHRT